MPTKHFYCVAVLYAHIQVSLENFPIHNKKIITFSAYAYFLPELYPQTAAYFSHFRSKSIYRDSVVEAFFYYHQEKILIKT